LINELDTIKAKTPDRRRQTMYKPYCISCDKKFNPNYSDTRKVYYFKLVYFAHICKECQKNYIYCEYCNELHWKHNFNGKPVCEPLDPGLNESP